MWLLLNDCFVSIVHKDCKRDEVMVRARRRGDIEKLFPGAKVTAYTKSDYLYRVAVSREKVKTMLCGEVDRVTYSNFKNSVHDQKLHDAYLRIWQSLADLQETKPYSGAPKKKKSKKLTKGQ